MKIFNNYFDYTQFCYEKQLKKELNKTGGLLITFSVAMSVIAVILFIAARLCYGTYYSDDIITENTVNYLVFNGVISLIGFFLIGLIYCLIRKLNLGSLFQFKKNDPKHIILISVLGLSVCMVSNYMTSIIIELFGLAGIDATVDNSFACNSTADIIVNYLSIAILPAFVEEFAFRGIILGSLRKYSDSFAVLVSAILFGLMHGNFTQIPFAFVVGLILGLVYVKTNSLLPSMIIHFLNNAVSVTFSILYDITDLSDNTINLIYVAVVFIVSVTGLVSGVILYKNRKDFFSYDKNENDSIIPFKRKMKLFCSSPTMIIFAVICILEAVTMLSFNF